MSSSTASPIMVRRAHPGSISWRISTSDGQRMCHRRRREPSVLPLHATLSTSAMVIRTKIMREIASIGDARPLIAPAQTAMPRMNCVAGRTA